MTLKKALKLAVQKWGKNAVVQKRDTPKDYPLKRCLVGTIEFGCFNVKAHADTFEEIFKGGVK